MKNRILALLLSCVAIVASRAQTPVAAGELFVDLDAADLAALDPGTTVTNWPNNGTAPGFRAVNTAGGPLFQTRDGIPVVRFSNTGANCLTNGPLGSVPASILANTDWSLEAWVFRTNNTGGLTVFSWTPREGIPNSNGTVMELRYHDANNFIEHYGADYNLAWGGARGSTLPAPAFGEWHHLAVTRETDGRERLYCDGRMVTEAYLPNMYLQADGVFTVGGVRRRTDGAWLNPFAGDIAQLRVHDGALTPEQVLNNYRADNARYNRALTHDAAWIGEWLYGIPADASRGLWLRGGDPLVLNASLSLPHLRPDSGGLTFTDGAALTVTAMSTLSFGYGAGNAFDLDIAAGSLTVPFFQNSTAIRLAFASGAGSSATVTVGDGTHPANLSSGGNLALGDYGGSAAMTVRANGTLSTPMRVRLGDRSSFGTLAIEAGGASVSSDFIAGALGGTGLVTVAGALYSSNTLFLGENAGGFGQLTLSPGGTATARELRPYNAEGFGRLIFDGGTLAATPNASSAFISGNTEILVTANGATVAVPSNAFVTVSCPVQEDASSPGGGLTKTGAGELALSGTNTLSSDIAVLGGALVFYGDAIPAAYTGTIHVANNAHIGYDLTGGASRLLSRLATNSVGTLRLYGYNTGESLDLSQHPGIVLQPRGTITQTGTVTPYGNRYVFAPNGLFTYSPVIADLPSLPASVTVRGIAADASVTLSGDNAAMTGGIDVENGTLALAHANAAGAIAAQDIFLAEGTTLKLAAAVPADFVQTRVTDDSRPLQILLAREAAHCDIDASRFPGCFTGTDGTNHLYTGTLTPAGTDYLLGGGKTAYASPNRGLVFNNLTDAPDTSPRRAVLGREGLVCLTNGNTHSGGTLVTNKAALYLSSDGLGALPAVSDPDNLTIDGGVLRSGNATFTLPAARGLLIGPGGAVFHPWGTYTLTLLGDLSGNGPVRFTDGGGVIAAGAANSYNGSVAVANGSATFGIGNGPAFSWASAGGITNNGNLTLNNDADAVFADTVHGGGRVRKLGGGTLTLTAAHPFTGRTVIKAGALAFSGNGSLAQGLSLINNGGLVVSGDAADGLAALTGPVYAGTGSVRVAGASARLLLTEGYDFPSGGLSAVSGGTLAAARPGALGTNDVTLSDATLSLAAAGVRAVDAFGDGWQRNGPSCVLVPTNGTVWLQITDNAGSRASSAFLTNRVQTAEPWTAEFDYFTGAMSGPADGFAFILHNDPRGPAALGGNGGALGMTTITRSIGFYVNIYGNDGIGWALNGARLAATTNVFGSANAIQTGNVRLRLAYDGRALTLTATKGSSTYTAFYATNLVAALGGTTAWLGFTGGTGGSTCQQFIANPLFACGHAAAPLQPFADADWQRNGDAAFTAVDDVSVLRVTRNESSLASAIWHKQKVNVTRPFTLACRYWVTAKSANPADGIALIFQNNALTSLGGSGGGLGVRDISTALGWGLDIYSNPNEALVWHQGGQRLASYRFENLAPNGITLDSGSPVDVTVAYDLYRMRITVTQDGHTASADSPAVNLADTFGAAEVYFGITGGTGGSTAEQYVSDVTLTAAPPVPAGETYENTVNVGGDSTLAVGARADAPGVAVEEIALEAGASLAVAAAAGTAANLPYTLTVHTLAVGGPGASVSVANNGTGTGTFVLGGALRFAAGADLTLQGVFAADGKIRLLLSETVSGSRALIDFTGATGLAAADFELLSPMPGAALRLRGNVLYVVNATGTVLQLR